MILLHSTQLESESSLQNFKEITLKCILITHKCLPVTDCFITDSLASYISKIIESFDY